MKNSFLRAVGFYTFGFLLVISSTNKVVAGEISEKSNNPFLLPQTTLFMGNANYQVHFSNSFLDSTSELNESGINTYGFDLEVNYSKFMNIGAYFRVESISVEANQLIQKQFATLLGGFTRFFYIPPFLQGKTTISNIFTRLELGGGPTFLGGPSGIMGQAGVYVGMETYINKWVGLSFSYGQVFEYGKETLVSGDQALALIMPQYRDATFWNHGRIFLVSLKTTFF